MYTKDQVELVDDTLDELTVELIAAACHQQNRMYCELLGDSSQLPWGEAHDWQQESAVNGVKAGLINPNPEASHESWLAEKKATGWTYGEVKDIEKKEHPCFLPYSDLPEEQKRKDHFFIEMVQQLGLAAGLIKVK